MKNFYTFIFSIFAVLFANAQQTINVSYTVNPEYFNETQSVKITFTGIDEAAWGVSSSKALYLWAWSTDHNNAQADSPTNGTWGSSGEENKLTYESTGVFSMTIVPSVFYGKTNLKTIGFLLKNKAGTVKSQDIVKSVGAYQLSLTNPAENSTTYLTSGSQITFSATSSLAGKFELKKNGSVIHTVASASAYSYNYTVSGTGNFELVGTHAESSTIISKKFSVHEKPTVASAAIPSWIRQGINYDPNDASKVGLALYAPGKEFVYVIGSFNEWSQNASFLMKRDTSNTNLFWLEISNLTPNQVYTFQYLTSDNRKVADPYSTLVLSPDDDPWISPNVYPNLPTYPAGQKYDVSVIQTGQQPYNWTVENFQKPNKDDLMIYEVLVRDFTSEKSWQSMIDKIPYIKGLNVNAIELLPVMEFDGNNSWGYNPSFHMALDKAYGTSVKFKEFIDKCHQNGLTVILDIALNHASGRSPLQRLWNTSSDGGYGEVAADNPYFNQTPRHSYNVFYDFDHSKPETRYYVNRVLEQWIKEYKIDGLRWDLTKGFTQNCSESDNSCTDSYQQDRVDVLKLYSDYQWSYDPSSIIIFEHLGSDAEEKEWANYRLGEGKGVLMWDKLTNPYNQNTMGYAENSNFNRVDYELHGFAERRNTSFAESHDEERLMYKNMLHGAQEGSYNVKNLNTALDRQKAQGAVLLTVPGPKMIWQFGELGYDFSINRCENGTISESCRTSPKPVAFEIGYDTVEKRKEVYDTWAKILQLRLSNEVFNTKTFTVESGNLLPRIYIWNDNIPVTSLKNVVVLANFTTSTKNVVPDFPFTGNWVNLMDNSTLSVTNTSSPLQLQPGEFRIYGNTSANLATENVISKDKISLVVKQNPAKNGMVNIRYSNAKNGVVALYDLSGKMVKAVKAEKESGDQVIHVDGLAAGTYLLQLKSESGLTATKVIIQ